ncbi:hypothetical protein CcaCcLH18_11426 [Colletotrichum camelliae]|nr:hypothetical protein CcaCcLH18_11426 [Colletotrichum camelliae]
MAAAPTKKVHLPGIGAAKSWETDYLRVAQINVKQSRKRMLNLSKHMAKMPSQWHVVALQDPPLDLPFLGTHFKRFRIIYRTEGGEDLNAYNNPQMKPKLKPNSRVKRDKDLVESCKEVPLYKVAFLVHKAIPEADYSIDWHHEEANEKLLVTMRLNTALPAPIFIHNTYNHPIGSRGRLNIDSLLQLCTVKGLVLFVGDFNLHHPLWGGNSLAADLITPESRQLAVGFTAAWYRCLLDPEAIKCTWSRSAEPDSSKSIIDLAFASETLHPLVQSYVVPDATGFKSDHRILETTLRVRPNRRTDCRYRWQDVTREAWRAEVGPKLKKVAPPAFTETGLDQFFAEVDKILQHGRDKLVPKSRPPTVNTRVRPSDPADRAPGKTTRFQGQEKRNENREASSGKKKAQVTASTPQSAPDDPQSSPTEMRHQRTKNWRMYLADRK